MTMLEHYWPNQGEISRCIKAEAETASEAVLLAVHQPMPLAVRNAGSQVEEPVTEQNFLDAFLTPYLPEGTLLQAVTGVSGAGKSHLIRWLAIQLRRDSRAKRMVVVRIPKSASLRTVVELILGPLVGDKRFALARDELRQAMAEITPATGAIRLVGGLQIALKSLAERLTMQIRADLKAPNRQELGNRLHHARCLPTFFTDATLEEHFKRNVLERIVTRSVQGHDQPQEDAPLPQFTTTDLILPDHIVENLGKASEQVRTYYQTILNRDGGKGFQKASEVLNEVLDQAIQEVFRLSQAVGGMTIEEIILHIRALLFEEDRELILLIEDFAALSGIQEVLLRVCIQEAVRDGQQVRAPMRTALAVTDGYLASRDTILTRARREWLVKTALATEEDIISSTQAMVAAYLNAARWGQDELERRFHAVTPDDDLTSWITTFSDDNLSLEESRILNDFGKGPKETPLFPYNANAIRSLAARHLSLGGRLQFLPRSIINYMLRDLLVMRDDFERGAFPPPGFAGAKPKVDIAGWLARTVSQPEQQKRIGSLLAHWGGNPETPDAVSSLPPGLFQAFDLPTPQDLGVILSITPSKPLPDPTRPPAHPPTRIDNSKVQQWRDKLEAWSAGKGLAQTDANVLRNSIVTLLKATIHWNAVRISHSVMPSLLIIIPKASGNDASALVHLEIADNHSDPDGRLRRSLMAIARYQLNKSTWSYEEGDEDSVIAANFIDGLAARFVATIETRVEAEIAKLADLLIWQARVIGIPVRDIGRPVGLIQLVRALPPERKWSQLPEGSAEARWQELQKKVYEERPKLQEMLVARLGCFQGIGNTAYALDAVRLWNAVQHQTMSPPRELDQGSLKAHCTDMSEVRMKARITPVVQNLRNFANKMYDALGNSFNKEIYLQETKELLGVVEKAGVWPSYYNKQDIYSAIEGFRKTAIMEILENIARLPGSDADAPLEGMLGVVSLIDLSVVRRAEGFVGTVTNFLKVVEQEVARKEQTVGGVDPEKKADELDACLQQISKDLAPLVEPEGGKT
ncbi:MAG: ATP-binding protein [Magnetococcales bacterium]|nr:ATP-binding protein [Magnetococcales bacterium]MBF0115785.1 ATP-binding protein [Magnetococcales bacterium]